MSEQTQAALNRYFMRFDDRAERLPPQQIVDTFVAVGPMLNVLANRSHQIIYGRRGVGKTHALRYFESRANQSGDLAIYIDCGNIGSNNSTYNDVSLSVTERATRLLIDVCLRMHWSFLEAFSDPKRGWSLADVGPLLDDFTDAIGEVRVEGAVTHEESYERDQVEQSGVDVGAKISRHPELSAKASSSGETKNIISVKKTREGNEIHLVNFHFLMSKTTTIAQYVSPERAWLLIDEWSTVPLDLQPYLADLIRRSFFSISNVSVKIAAIEQRSAFKVANSTNGYVGIELGADASVALNLDDYLVYDANQERSVDFFRRLIRNHIRSKSKEEKVDLGEGVYEHWSSHAFTQENVFIELVKACEGVPRDVMHILSNAAQRTPANQITAPTLRHAALQFFKTEKYSAIASNPMNRKLLDWIRYKVIDQRNTRAFLLQVGTSDPIIDNLFDLRALHILFRSMSAAHRPGERYVVYKLDYGCYVDLTNTDKFPSGGLLSNDP